MKIEVPCVPLCELVFCDPVDPTNKDKQVTKLADFDYVVRQFRAIDETYPLSPGEETTPSDFDAVGARMAAWQEVIQSLNANGPDPGQAIPPQTEGTLSRLRALLYNVYNRRSDDEKKTVAPAARPPAGKSSLSSGTSPSVPPSASMSPAGPLGEETSPTT